MIARLARITVAGVPRVVDLLALRNNTPGYGFGQAPFATSTFGSGAPQGFGNAAFATSPFAGETATPASPG